MHRSGVSCCEQFDKRSKQNQARLSHSYPRILTSSHPRLKNLRKECRHSGGVFALMVYGILQMGLQERKIHSTLSLLKVQGEHLGSCWNRALNNFHMWPSYKFRVYQLIKPVGGSKCLEQGIVLRYFHSHFRSGLQRVREYREFCNSMSFQCNQAWTALGAEGLWIVKSCDGDWEVTDFLPQQMKGMVVYYGLWDDDVNPNSTCFIEAFYRWGSIRGQGTSSFSFFVWCLCAGWSLFGLG